MIEATFWRGTKDDMHFIESRPANLNTTLSELEPLPEGCECVFIESLDDVKVLFDVRVSK